MIRYVCSGLNVNVSFEREFTDDDVCAVTNLENHDFNVIGLNNTNLCILTPTT